MQKSGQEWNLENQIGESAQKHLLGAEVLGTRKHLQKTYNVKDLLESECNIKNESLKLKDKARFWNIDSHT
jgi:hypothetical protein